ncbi:MAG: hypothetical protein R3F43_32535, partial [bacterium]
MSDPECMSELVNQRPSGTPARITLTQEFVEEPPCGAVGATSVHENDVGFKNRPDTPVTPGLRNPTTRVLRIHSLA